MYKMNLDLAGAINQNIQGQFYFQDGVEETKRPNTLLKLGSKHKRSDLSKEVLDDLLHPSVLSKGFM